MKKLFRHLYWHVTEFFIDPLATVEFDENDMPVITRKYFR